MTESVVSEFTRVDSSPDAEWFVAFMDRANALPEYGQMRDLLADGLRLHPGHRVLDAGCGTGDDARMLAPRVGAKGHVVGVDASAAMVQVAVSRNISASGPRFEVGEINALRFDSAAFDGVRAKLTLMHCTDPVGALSEMVRVLKPGGRLAVFDYDFDTTTLDHPDRDLTRAVVAALADAHPGAWTARGYRRLAHACGLTEVDTPALTVQMPWEFWSRAVRGRIEASVASGALSVSPGRIEQWWATLEESAARGTFHTSITGFAVLASRPSAA